MVTILIFASGQHQPFRSRIRSCDAFSNAAPLWIPHASGDTAVGSQPSALRHHEFNLSNTRAPLHVESSARWLTPLIDTAVAFHQAVRGAHDDLAATIDRLRQETAGGDFAYYVDIATAMGDLSQAAGSAVRWLDDARTVRERWRGLVIARQDHLRGTQ